MTEHTVDTVDTVDKVALSIDGLAVTASGGTNLMEAAAAAGIYIPHLCYHPDVEPVGVCRLCMVQVEGRGSVLACRTPVEQGLVVKTVSPEIDKLRRTAVELLIVNHHGECLACDRNNQCELQRIAAYVGVDQERLQRLRRSTRTLPLDTSNPFFTRDPNKCVLCGICVRTCDQLQGVGATDFAFRGQDTTISTFANRPIVESRCESCGECVVRCPVGALSPKGFQQPSREVKTVCPYCGVGCGMYLGVRGNRIVSVRGDLHSPVNRGSLCVKGRFGHEFVHHPERLRTPLIKTGGELVPATWDEALALVAEKLAQFRGERCAVISSAKCTNEENYLIQKLARAVLGTNHIDHCARLCHAPTVAGLAQSLGSGAMTNSIREIEDAACILAVGTNTTAAHPVIGLQIRTAVRKGAKLIVANPKEIDLCRDARVFLRQRPGTDVALLMGMARVIVDEGLADTAFIDQRCEDFEPFKASLQKYDLDFVERTTGVPRAQIVEAARLYATCRPGAILYAMGITQSTHGTDNVLATSNLALLTGNIGRPSAGVNPLRGQNNVQGACDMGALPNVLPGYQRLDNPDVKAKFESAWGCSLNASPGLTHLEILDAVLSCQLPVASCQTEITDNRQPTTDDRQLPIEAMYLVGENPILSEANSGHVEEALRQLKFLVVQDIFLTETARLAHVVLPAAAFAEKDGTFTNTERRVQRVRKAVDPPGEAKPDWWITCQIAKRLVALLACPAVSRGFDFLHPSQIMEEIAGLVPSYHGISYDRLDEQGLQWPCTSEEHAGTPILHTERFATTSGKARFIPLEFKPPAEVPDDDYPLTLTTDRSLFHFHTSTMTGRVEGLRTLNPEELLRINPADASRLGIADGETVEVSSRRGKLVLRAKITDACPAGLVSASFHFAETRTNLITNNALDPVSKIPETKVCAVRVEKLRPKAKDPRPKTEDLGLRS